MSAFKPRPRRRYYPSQPSRSKPIQFRVIDESKVQLSEQEVEFLSPLYKGLATRVICAVRPAPLLPPTKPALENKKMRNAIRKVLSVVNLKPQKVKPGLEPSTANLATTAAPSPQVHEPEPIRLPSMYHAALARWGKLDDCDLLAHHGDIRRILQNLLRGFMCDSTPSSRDSEDVENLALRVIASPEQRLKLRELRGEHAQTVLDILIQLVDRYPEAQHNFEVNREIRKIAHSSGHIPRALFLSRVVCGSTSPAGIGGYGDVFLGKHEGRSVAVKRLRVPRSAVTAGMEKALFYEALLWRQLKHPNILEFLGVSRDVHENFYSLVSPWMASGDAHTYLHSHPQADRLALIKGVAEGLRYLHVRTPPVVHADLRGGNILVNDRGEAQLCDFGLAKLVRRHTTTTAASNTNQRGTFRWMSPELILNESEHHTTASDVWAFGCVCLEITARVGPYDDTSERNDALVLISISRGVKPCLQQPGDGVTPTMWGFMNQCWKREPELRPTMATLVEEMRTKS